MRGTFQKTRDSESKDKIQLGQDCEVLKSNVAFSKNEKEKQNALQEVMATQVMNSSSAAKKTEVGQNGKVGCSDAFSKNKMEEQKAVQEAVTTQEKNNTTAVEKEMGRNGELLDSSVAFSKSDKEEQNDVQAATQRINSSSVKMKMGQNGELFNSSDVENSKSNQEVQKALHEVEGAQAINSSAVEKKSELGKNGKFSDSNIDFSKSQMEVQNATQEVGAAQVMSSSSVEKKMKKGYNRELLVSSKTFLERDREEENSVQKDVGAQAMRNSSVKQSMEMRRSGDFLDSAITFPETDMEKQITEQEDVITQSMNSSSLNDLAYTEEKSFDLEDNPVDTRLVYECYIGLLKYLVVCEEYKELLHSFEVFLTQEDMLTELLFNPEFEQDRKYFLSNLAVTQQHGLTVIRHTRQLMDIIRAIDPVTPRDNIVKKIKQTAFTVEKNFKGLIAHCCELESDLTLSNCGLMHDIIFPRFF